MDSTIPNALFSLGVVVVGSAWQASRLSSSDTAGESIVVGGSHSAVDGVSLYG